MKKPKLAVLVIILAMAMLATSIFIMPAVAQESQMDVYENHKLVKSIVFAIGAKEYFVNNQTPGVKMDVVPFIKSGRTYVPVRYLSNALGVTDENIGWDEKKKLVTLEQPGFPLVELTIGSKTIKSDGQARQMEDAAPMIRDKRTFLPARFVAEALGYQVDWDSVNQVVICWPKGTEKPDVGKVLEHLKPELVQATPFVAEGKITDKFTSLYGMPATLRDCGMKHITLADLPHMVGTNVVHGIRVVSHPTLPDRYALMVDQYNPAGWAVAVHAVEKGVIFKSVPGLLIGPDGLPKPSPTPRFESTHPLLEAELNRADTFIISRGAQREFEALVIPNTFK